MIRMIQVIESAGCPLKRQEVSSYFYFAGVAAGFARGTGIRFTFKADIFFIRSLKLKQTQLQLRRLGHHALVPRRIPDELDVRLVNRFERDEFVLHVLREHRTHAAAGRGQSHFHVGLVIVRADGREVAIVNQAKVHDVDGNLRVVTRLERFPDFFLKLLLRERAARRGGGGRGRSRHFEAQRVGVLRLDAEHIAVDDDGVSATERLRDVRLLTFLERDLGADGNHGGFHIARQNFLFGTHKM